MRGTIVSILCTLVGGLLLLCLCGAPIAGLLGLMSLSNSVSIMLLSGFGFVACTMLMM